jgi:serine beta-lactamase-like protein LACTB
VNNFVYNLLSGLTVILIWTPLAAGITVDQSNAIKEAARSALSEQRIAGFTVAVLYQDEIVFNEGFGFADLENQVPAKPETVYRLASVSKTLSAVLTMQLVESGDLELEKDVRTYCPEFPEKPWTITLRQLLSHTSGIRGYKDSEMDSTKAYTSMIEGMNIFKDDPLEFKPGTDYLYSTYAYTVLGCVIEGATKKKFDSLLKEKLFEEAGMTTARADSIQDLIPNRAQGYVRTTDSWKNSGLMDSTYKIPGGGLVSSAEDAVKFARSLLNDSFVKPETRQEMFTPVPATVAKAPYGLGWRLGAKDFSGEVYHTGKQQRVATLLYLLPKRNFAVAILTNTEDTGNIPLARRIAQIVTLDFK